jgi:release factor glutamine methyltransferase
VPAERALREASIRLESAGISSARTDAELLLARALESPATGAERPTRAHVVRLALLGESLPAPVTARFHDLIGRRAAREPLQHLTGWAGFRTFELEVGPGVFVPRPETEVVAGFAVEEARRLAAEGGSPLVVDLCTGSGAIAFAVALEIPSARVVALELDLPALDWARRNRSRLGLDDRVDLRPGDAQRADQVALGDLAGDVDVVVSNPPYIPPDAEPNDPEVRDHDPILALYGGGDDGLAVPGAVVRAAAGLLRPDGLLVMEHAESQARGARALAAPADWRGVTTADDLTGRPRALLARRAPRLAAPPTPRASGVTHSQP